MKSSAEIVEESETLARALTKWHSTGAGDYGLAMQEAARAAGVSFSLFWSLHYKKPKDVWASSYLKIKAAYDRQCERQMRKIIDGARRAKQSGIDPARINKALALVDLNLEEIEDEYASGSTKCSPASATTAERPRRGHESH